MPPKKGKKNALTFYIETTLIPELQREGGYQFRNGIAALIPEASRRFKDLPPHEKERYEQLARDHRDKNKRVADDTRRDNCGNIIADRRDPRQVMLQKRKEDRQLLRDTFVAGRALLEAKFYVIGFEYMVEVVRSLDEVEYPPVEVGIVEWSMGGGISREFHRVINPGDIPLGYRFKFQEHSEETHRFTIERIQEGDSNYRSLWMQMENFVNPDVTLGRMRVVYCLEHQNDKIKSCLSWLHQRAMCGPDSFKLRFLEDLSLELFTHASKNVSESSILNMLTTSVFDYEPNTRCKYHDEAETLHCALGTAKRYTFAMSDSLASVYNFELTPNHVPTRSIAKQNYVTVGPNQEQLVPDLRRPPVGRGCSVESDSFAARDIRYLHGANMARGDASSSLTASAPFPRPPNAVPNSNVGLRPPPASRLPAPSFHAGVEDGIRNMNMSEPVPQLNPPRTMMPNVAYRPPAGGPSVPVVRPQAASPMRPPDAAAAWRGMAPVPMAQAYPASSSTPTFYSATHGDSDDDSFDASSMMSAATGASSYVPCYGGGGLGPPIGRGMPQYSGPSAPSEMSVGSSSFSYRSATCSGRFEEGAPPAVGRGVGLGRGQQVLQSAAIGVGRGTFKNNDKSIRPPPGFRGTDGFTGM